MAKKFINSFKLEGLKIYERTEKNTNINSHTFVIQAYQMKTLVFVSDYCRLKALYEI